MRVVMGLRLVLFYSFRLLLLCTAGQLIACAPTLAEIPGNNVSEILDEINVTTYGVVGDGIKDDTRNFQTALDYCSEHSKRCIVPSDLSVRITRPVFIWGSSSLRGNSGSEIHVDFGNLKNRYVLNLGLRRIRVAGTPFSGRIENLTFRVVDGPLDKWDEEKYPIAGRIIQFWRAKNVVISNNEFDIGVYFYAATAGHINRKWLKGIGERENITISGNTVRAKAGSHGMEGIGINYAKNVTISNNSISGVGDDLIGVHFCDQVKVIGNNASGVDGRIFLSNSTNVLVESNILVREPSPLDGEFKRGVSLIYVGYEYPARAREPKPTNTVILNNVLRYPAGAIDGGAAINIRGAEKTLVKGNVIINDSKTVSAHGIWIAPWEDPNIDDFEFNQRTYPIIDARIVENRLLGKYPLEIVQTGACYAHKGRLEIKDNEARVRRKSCPDVDELMRNNVQ